MVGVFSRYFFVMELLNVSRASHTSYRRKIYYVLLEWNAEGNKNTKYFFFPCFVRSLDSCIFHVLLLLQFFIRCLSHSRFLFSLFSTERPILNCLLFRKQKMSAWFMCFGAFTKSSANKMHAIKTSVHNTDTFAFTHTHWWKWKANLTRNLNRKRAWWCEYKYVSMCTHCTHTHSISAKCNMLEVKKRLCA